MPASDVPVAVIIHRLLSLLLLFLLLIIFSFFFLLAGLMSDDSSYFMSSFFVLLASPLKETKFMKLQLLPDTITAHISFVIVSLVLAYFLRDVRTTLAVLRHHHRRHHRHDVVDVFTGSVFIVLLHYLRLFPPDFLLVHFSAR